MFTNLEVQVKPSLQKKKIGDYLVLINGVKLDFQSCEPVVHGRSDDDKVSARMGYWLVNIPWGTPAWIANQNWAGKVLEPKSSDYCRKDLEVHKKST